MNLYYIDSGFMSTLDFCAKNAAMWIFISAILLQLSNTVYTIMYYDVANAEKLILSSVAAGSRQNRI